MIHEFATDCKSHQLRVRNLKIISFGPRPIKLLGLQCAYQADLYDFRC